MKPIHTCNCYGPLYFNPRKLDGEMFSIKASRMGPFPHWWLSIDGRWTTFLIGVFPHCFSPVGCSNSLREWPSPSPCCFQCWLWEITSYIQKSSATLGYPSELRQWCHIPYPTQVWSKCSLAKTSQPAVHIYKGTDASSPSSPSLLEASMELFQGVVV